MPKAHGCQPFPDHVLVDYAFDRTGGFAARIPGTSVFAYAHPSSETTGLARRSPIIAARMMLEAEMCSLSTVVEYWGYHRLRQRADDAARRFGWNTNS